jgi:phenylacetate-CoA ligase
MHQRCQLDQIVAHAAATVPFYSRRFAHAGIVADDLTTPENWQRLPLLSRRDLQLSGPDLCSNALPAEHGQVTRAMTSGSTSEPVVTCATDVTKLFWQAITLRDHEWHRRDLSGTLAAIRHLSSATAFPPDGISEDNWGPATRIVHQTGQAHLLNIRSSISEQWDWLVRVDPTYLVSYPSILAAIGELAATRNAQLASLREVRTFGELLDLRSRAHLEATFGTKVVDVYSTREVGYAALRCPTSDQYHVPGLGNCRRAGPAQGRDKAS